jgi:ABC-type cobalamin transport system permease subunit
VTSPNAGPNWPLRIIIISCIALVGITKALDGRWEMCTVVIGIALNIAFFAYLSWILFFSQSMGLTDLMVIIAILGNVVGIAAQQVYSRNFFG